MAASDHPSRLGQTRRNGEVHHPETNGVCVGLFHGGRRGECIGDGDIELLRRGFTVYFFRPRGTNKSMARAHEARAVDGDGSNQARFGLENVDWLVNADPVFE